MIEEEISCSQSSSSSSSSSKDWSGYPIIIGRGECFNSNRHIHIEDRNPDIIAHDLSAFAWGRNNINIKITINNIEIPMRSGNLDNLREDIIATIENEKHHFFKKGDFEIC